MPRRLLQTLWKWIKSVIHGGNVNMKLLITCLFALCVATAQAQVFKCKTEDGKTTYSDTPCSGSVDSVEQVQGSRDYVSPQARAQAEQLKRQNATNVSALQRAREREETQLRQKVNRERLKREAEARAPKNQRR
jgi:TolA-binding protein